MGPISRKELLMAGLALFALVLWIFGGKAIDSTTTAFIALCLMLLFKVISWDDLLANKQAWNVLMWFGTLVALADGLAKTGFLTWFAGGVAAHLAGYSLTTVMVALVVGDQTAIAQDDWTVFRLTGIAHLVSISGLHVTMFAWLARLAAQGLEGDIERDKLEQSVSLLRQELDHDRVLVDIDGHLRAVFS